jgi:hypothetical protein
VRAQLTRRRSRRFDFAMVLVFGIVVYRHTKLVVGEDTDLYNHRDMKMTSQIVSRTEVSVTMLYGTASDTS